MTQETEPANVKFTWKKLDPNPVVDRSKLVVPRGEAAFGQFHPGVELLQTGRPNIVVYVNGDYTPDGCLEIIEDKIKRVIGNVIKGRVYLTKGRASWWETSSYEKVFVHEPLEVEWKTIG